MHRFESEFLIDAPRAVAFEFHLQTANLIGLLPADSGVQLLSGPPHLSLGSEFEISVSLLGHTQKLAFRIAEVTAPTLIAVEQVRGPFRSWRETNRYDDAAGATRLTYSVDFVPPGGLLGFFATPARILEQLEQGFRERRERTGPAVSAWSQKQ